MLSNPNLTGVGADADRIRQVLIATGARVKVANMITTRCTQALRALEAAPLPLTATAALRKLVDAATARAS
ncbi:hypothetical protein [Streptomyces syringium]|uniref:hypothetical protein n=1 Tax=Streptomyces syringium TaxID=76729 RepID=UPI0034561ED8